MAVPLASGVAYALTAASTVQGGDSGELAAVGASGGVAHPPGYPLFILWARAWQWLPATSPSHRVALATAVLGALAVDAVQGACVAWGASPLAAALAAAIFAVSPLAWRLSSEPEVFMLNVLIALTIVRVAAPGKWSEEQRGIALALLAGLGIANHHSVILLAPIGLYAWVRAFRATVTRGRMVLGSVLALALGLSPYAYLALARSDCSWGDTSTLTGLVHHFLRADYGTTRLAANAIRPEPGAQVGLLASTFVDSGVAFPLLAAVILALGRRRWSWPVATLVLTLLVAGPLFASRFNLPPRGVTATVVRRFHLLPLALASVLGAFGIDAILGLLQHPLARRLTIGAALAAVGARAALSGQAVTVHQRPTVERYLRNVLAFLPPNSVLVAMGDDVVGGLEYMQCTVGARPDVVVLVPQLLNSDWYPPRMSAKLGVDVVRGVVPPGKSEPVLDSTSLVEQLLATGRPVFVTQWFANKLEAIFPSYPIGPLIRLTTTPADVPTPARLLVENDRLLGQMELDPIPPFAHTWAAARYRDYARPWNVLANAFEMAGDRETASRCRDRANALAPRPSSE